MACPRCGAASRPDQLFCDTCGTRLSGVSAAEPASVAAARGCPACGNPNRAGAVRCTACGAKLNPGGPDGSSVLVGLMEADWILGFLFAGVFGLVGAIVMLSAGQIEYAIVSGLISAVGWAGPGLMARYAP